MHQRGSANARRSPNSSTSETTAARTSRRSARRPVGVADDHDDGDVGGRGEGADPADDLAVEALGVEVALAGDDDVGGARSARRGRRARRRGRSRGRSRAPTASNPPASPPAAPRAVDVRGRRHRTRRGSARRVARRRACSSRTWAGVAPFCGANTLAASTNRVRTSQATWRSTAPSRARLPSASMAPSPPSVVAEPPRPTSTVRAPWSIALAISSPVPRVVAASGSLPSAPPARTSPLARAISMTAVRRSIRHARLDGRAERPGHHGRSVAAPEHVEQALAAVGHRYFVAVGAELPARRSDRGRRLGGGQRAAELVEGGDHPHPRTVVSNRWVPVGPKRHIGTLRSSPAAIPDLGGKVSAWPSPCESRPPCDRCRAGRRRSRLLPARSAT